jgi:hypothetical protein
VSVYGHALLFSSLREFTRDEVGRQRQNVER